MEHEAKKQETERLIEEGRLEQEKRRNETLLRQASHGYHIITGVIISLLIRIILFENTFFWACFRVMLTSTEQSIVIDLTAELSSRFQWANRL